MTKREVRELLSRLLPYVKGKKQAAALFAVLLLLALTHGAFDAPHLHVEPISTVPMVTVSLSASGAPNVASIRIDQIA